MKKIKVIVLYLIISFTIIFPVLQIIDLNSMGTLEEISNEDKDIQSSDITNTKQWITNGDFSSQENWTTIKGELGDPNDINAYISGGNANFEVLGDSGTYSLTGIPDSTWTAFPNNDWGVFMQEGTEQGIDSDGCWVDYVWDEQYDQTGNTPSVHWKKNITLPLDMSDYKITSASIEVIFNATVQVSSVGNGGIDCPGDTGVMQVGDYAKFYVLISDIENVYQPFQVAYNRTRYLGKDTPSTPTINDKPMTPIDETLLINYLELVLGVNSTTFTMTLGLDLYCEDNDPSYDEDNWEDLRIKDYNLTFTYERKIDQLTSISFNQEGDKPSDISGFPIVINGAILNFQYKLNDTWPIYSPNSEFRILINDVQHSETVKLSTGITTFKDAKTGGFDVTYLIDKNKNVNLSLQVYLADEFELDRYINISIDNVYLNITYTEIIEDVETDYELYLNAENKTLDPVISIPLGENLNITVKYLENQTRDHISEATVQLEGKVSGILTENLALQHYNITINTNDLGIGVKTLTVVAEKTDYVTQSIQFFIEVTERETELLLFLNSDPKNDGDTIQVKVNEFINVTVYYNDNATKQFLSGATVTLLGTGNLNETNGHYNITIDTNDLDQGINAFTVFAQLKDYKPQSIQFFVELIERETELLLYLNSVPKNDKDKIQVQIDEFINVTVYYNDNETKQLLTGATVTLLGIDNLTETPSHYNITIDTNDLDPGITIFTIFAQLENHRDQTIQFFVELIERETELLLYLNSVPKNDKDKIQVQIDEFINVTVYYNDNETKQLLTGATVTLLGIDNLTETPNHYNITIDTNDLDPGITIYTIFAQLENHRDQTIQFFVELIEIETALTLFIDGEDITSDPSITRYPDEILNITVSYERSVPVSHIPGAIVDINGSGISELLTEAFNNYSMLINTADLNQGVNFLTIFARKTGYEPQTILLVIEIIQIETIITLFIDGEDITSDPSITRYPDEILNITVSYERSIPIGHIPGAIVDINGSGISELLTEAFNNYSVLINTANLNQGVNFLTIFARKAGYEPQTISLIIQIIQIETIITLFIDGEEQPINPSITRYPNQILNITVSYERSIPIGHIPGAIVDINGSGISELLTEAFNNYSVLINTADLNQGVNFLTIFARKTGYEPQTISLIIQIIQIETILTLFIDGEDITSDPSITRYPNQILNITVSYERSIPIGHIPGAIVDINGSGISELLTEAFNNYSVLINTADLNQGANFLTIFARKNSYEPQTILLIIEIIQIETNLTLYLNGVDKTLDPVFNLTIGQNLNITVKYADQFGAFISNATILLIGEGLSLNFMKDDTFDQYYIILNTNDLGIGVKLLSIIAQKPNFQPITKNSRITINRILAEIITLSGEAQIEAEIGDNVLLQIILTDTIFGADITGAIVTYTWAYGQGELFDSDNDGIFEIVLENVQEGVHTITINAFAEDEYDFKSYDITLVVIPPIESAGPDLGWLIYVLGGGIVGIVSIFILYQKHFKYPPMVRKIRKLRKKVRKGKKMKPIMLNKREDIINENFKGQIQILESKPIKSEKDFKVQTDSKIEKSDNSQNGGI